MKKLLFFVTIACLSLTFSACNNDEIEAAKRSNDSLQNIINNKDGEIDALFEMLNQIEDNLAMISAKYSSVRELQRDNPEKGYNVKGEINSQISNIESMLEANKKKIGELNAKIATLGKENTRLQEFVSKLEERVAEQESQISSLMAEIESNKTVIKDLNQNVSELTQSNQEKDARIAQHIAEANRAYYIVGSYNDLKEAGIVSKSGGFIGIGKKQGTLENMPTEKFTEIDRTRTTTVEVNLKNAMLISKHPADSYELVADENDEKVTAYLKILNPTRFWQQTRYLVISTK